MTHGSLAELEFNLNHGSIPEFIATGAITKRLVGQQNQYKFVVNSNDHPPPHIHISLHNKQIASYSLETGEPIKSENSRLDKIVTSWLMKPGNREKALKEWNKFHGSN